MAIFNSYVKLPEGTPFFSQLLQLWSSLSHLGRSGSSLRWRGRKLGSPFASSVGLLFNRYCGSQRTNAWCQWPFQEPIYWRYLSYIRPIQGLCRGISHWWCSSWCSNYSKRCVLGLRPAFFWGYIILYNIYIYIYMGSLFLRSWWLFLRMSQNTKFY
jgi:hypothetical protein